MRKKRTITRTIEIRAECKEVRAIRKVFHPKAWCGSCQHESHIPTSDEANVMRQKRTQKSDIRGSRHRERDRLKIDGIEGEHWTDSDNSKVGRDMS